MEQGKISAQQAARSGLRDEYAGELSHYREKAAAAKAALATRGLPKEEQEAEEAKIDARLAEVEQGLKDAYGISERFNLRDTGPL